MLQGDYLNGSGIGGPPPPNAYKRAVYRNPPPHFDVEVLSPQKLGSSHAYGMRICPHQSDADDTGDKKSTRSGSSGSYSTSEYTVWRRWDDCLWFQDVLEMEYSMQSREKRRRLAQGKGVKKNGVYVNSDMASSFESLPPGPDPNTIAKHIHEFLPRLTKKGTLFRASQATVDQRHKQFEALINTLLQDDMPMLIRELRQNRNVRDFFGYWRRDKDFERKAGADKRAHTTSNPWSLSFSASNLSLPLSVSFKDLPPSPGVVPAVPGAHNLEIHKTHGTHLPKHRHSGYTDSEPEPPSPSRQDPPNSAPADYGRGRYGHSYMLTTQQYNPSESSSASSGSDIPQELAMEIHVSPSNRQSRSSTLLAFPTSPTIHEHGFEYPDVPFDPSHNGNSPNLGLSPLPGVGEARHLTTPVRRAQSTYSDKRNRNCVIFSQTPPQSPTLARGFLDAHDEVANGVIEAPPLTPKTSSNITTSTSSPHSSIFSTPSSRRSSWQTSIEDFAVRPSSGQSQYDPLCIDIDRSLTDSPGLQLSPWFADGKPAFPRHHHSYSISSINSVMTDSSVDRVLPRYMPSTSAQSSKSLRRSFSAGSRTMSRRYSQAMAVPEEEPWSQENDGDLVNSYLYGDLPASPEPDKGVGTPNRERISQRVPASDQFPKLFQNRPPGQFHIPWTPPPFSTPPQSPNSPTFKSGINETFAIKAILKEDSIIVFRAFVGISYTEIRQKIYDKFVRQEGLPMSGSFKLGYLVHGLSRLSTDTGRSGGQRRSWSSSISCIDASDPMLRYINSEEEWQDAVRSCGGKLNLRIFESAP